MKRKGFETTQLLGTEQLITEVNSKYGRTKVPVKMEKMLSRQQQKTQFCLEAKGELNGYAKVLDKYGYKP